MTLSNPMTFQEALASQEVNLSELKRLAQESDLLFVRSLDQLAEDSPAATGRLLSAWEALRAYGRDVLLEVINEGSALLCDSPDAAGRVLKARREQLGLTTRQTANRARVQESVLLEAEKSSRLPLRDYEKIGRALGLDERLISVKSEPVGNDRLAVRLRTIGDALVYMDNKAVSAIAEASWVAMTQIRLEEDLEIQPPTVGITPSDNYGKPDYPAYLHGYYLAYDAREKLGLGSGRLESLRRLCEESLGIPLIQAELGDSIAGVTVETGGRRAIVINLDGRNRHVYVRRSTIAHELGHLLYDVSQQLNELRVDDYDDLEKAADQIPDKVEQRANAFAVEFVAPQKEIIKLKNEDDPVGRIMDTFGISYTAARYQLWNALERNTPLEDLTSNRREPLSSFQSSEAYTTDYHPINGLTASRAGRFSAVVLRAAEENIISWNTAAEYLACSIEELRKAKESIRELFPTVFNPSR